MLPRFFVQTPMFSVSPSSFSLSERLSRRYCNKHHHQAMSLSILCCTSMTDFVLSVCACGLEVTVGISEASKRVPTFSFATHGGKQVSSHFRQGNWDKTSRLRPGRLEHNCLGMIVPYETCQYDLASQGRQNTLARPPVIRDAVFTNCTMNTPGGSFGY